MPIFSWVTPTFFALIRFVIGFANYSVEIIRHYRWNNGYLTPKTVLKQGFWGQIPVFSRVTPIFFSFEWIHHRIWTSLDYFRPVWIKHNHFETISGQFGIFSDIFFNYFEWFWITSQHIRDWPRLFLTIPVGMTALNQLSSPILTFFGVKCPFFHGWHPLFLHWLDSLLDLPITL